MKLAETPPSRCSSCFQQVPQRRHIDFEVAWDGPVFAHETVGVTPVAIDDLVVCEECLTTAAGLLGLEDPGENAEALQDATGLVAGLQERLAEREEYIAQLERTVASKPGAAVA